MNNALRNAIGYAASQKVTENGAKAFNQLSNPVLTMFAQAGSLRPRTEQEIREMYRQAYAYDSALAIKMLFYIGDIRGGLGERRTFRICLNELALINPTAVIVNLPFIAEFNRWDSLYSLVGTKAERDMWDFMRNQWQEDVDALVHKRSCSLLAKWMKSINASSEETRKLARLTMQNLNFTSEKVYRKCLSEMRSYIKVVEKAMSSGKWETINYQAVPSYAMKNYRSAFGRHDYERFNAYIQDVTSGKKTIKASTLFPYDLVANYTNHPYGRSITPDPVIEAQWKALPNYLKNDDTNIICMVDVSGSMYGRPIASSIGLGTYFAQRNHGAFHNMYMTFTNEPHFIQINDGESLASIVNKVLHTGVGYNTNLEAAFNELLKVAVKNKVPRKDMPKALVIISDNEIDRFRNQKSVDFMTAMEKKFNDWGYDLPKLVFFQVESRQNTFLTLRPDALFISGNSAAAFKQVVDNLEGTAWDLALNTLNGERYENIYATDAQIKARYDFLLDELPF